MNIVQPTFLHISYKYVSTQCMSKLWLNTIKSWNVKKKIKSFDKSLLFHGFSVLFEGRTCNVKVSIFWLCRNITKQAHDLKKRGKRSFQFASFSLKFSMTWINSRLTSFTALTFLKPLYKPFFKTYKCK